MILKILEKLGRKKIVLDRGPSHPEFHKAKLNRISRMHEVCSKRYGC